MTVRVLSQLGIGDGKKNARRLVSVENYPVATEAELRRRECGLGVPQLLRAARIVGY